MSIGELVSRGSLTCNTSSVTDNCFCHSSVRRIKKPTLEEQGGFPGGKIFELVHRCFPSNFHIPHHFSLTQKHRRQPGGSPHKNYKDKCQIELVNPDLNIRTLYFMNQFLKFPSDHRYIRPLTKFFVNV